MSKRISMSTFWNDVLNPHFFQLFDVPINLVNQALNDFPDYREGLLNASQGLLKIGSEGSMIGHDGSELANVSMLLKKLLEPGVGGDDGIDSRVGRRGHVDSGLYEVGNNTPLSILDQYLYP